MNVSEFFKYARSKLNFMPKETVDSEIRILLERYLNFKDIDFILNKEKQISDLELLQLIKAVDSRLKGVPIQYIIGKWFFMDMELDVGNGVLIPREDTQVLVEVINSKIKGPNNKIIDICSGSGCVALAIEKFNKNATEIYALEKFPEAYHFLVKNTRNLNSKVKTINKDLLVAHEDFKEHFFDFIVSNPPYIKSKEIDFLQREVLYEPKTALDGGENGLFFYENICKFWIPKLKLGGSLVFEIGKGQFQEVQEIMLKNGLQKIEYKKDINGIIRVISGVL